MDVITDIATWVEKKPLVLVAFDAEKSSRLLYSRQGINKFTYVKPHEEFDFFKLPTLCLVEFIEHNEQVLYIGVLKRKAPVSTMESRLTFSNLQRIYPNSLKAITKHIIKTRFHSAYNEKIPIQNSTSILTPKLSSNIIHTLSKFDENTNAFNNVVSAIPKLRPTPQREWAQGNAISTALEVFGIDKSYAPSQLIIKKGQVSGLSQCGHHVLEDNVIIDDARNIHGFKAIESSITGRALFRKGDEELEVITANRGPLEEMFGVDMIYINDKLKSITMVQYKMLEEAEAKEIKDWVFRPQKHDFAEISRMKIPNIDGKPSSYRLNSNPFYFKFVKRKVVENSHQSFIMSTDHLKQLLDSPDGKGPKGGLRISYNVLDGSYLREKDFIGLIRSGYIGTHGTTTKMLSPIINEAFTGNKALVLAWQKRIEQVDN
ncbi:hypothetical protein [Maridesulfovibrio sp.]|uniref:hypothetical protein n=1 Tax=Maridesulfovibrio sp. TaxID=2795000 RepID=UPI0029C9DB1B|nr:hypothetical protein [Maridesulfovibrio sp.]